MTAPRDGHGAPAPMTFDQFFDSPFARRATLADVAVILREVDRSGGPEAFKALHMNRHPGAALLSCPRPFCGAAAAFDDDGECGYAVRCTACGCALYNRHGEPAAALVARWNAPRLPPAVAPPAFLRELAARSGFAESQQLADAAQLIEQQAAALDGAR